MHGYFIVSLFLQTIQKRDIDIRKNRHKAIFFIEFSQHSSAGSAAADDQDLFHLHLEYPFRILIKDLVKYIFPDTGFHQLPASSCRKIA